MSFFLNLLDSIMIPVVTLNVMALGMIVVVAAGTAGQRGEERKTIRMGMSQPADERPTSSHSETSDMSNQAAANKDVYPAFERGKALAEAVRTARGGSGGALAAIVNEIERKINDIKSSYTTPGGPAPPPIMKLPGEYLFDTAAGPRISVKMSLMNVIDAIPKIYFDIEIDGWTGGAPPAGAETQDRRDALVSAVEKVVSTVIPDKKNVILTSDLRNTLELIGIFGIFDRVIPIEYGNTQYLIVGWKEANDAVRDAQNAVKELEERKAAAENAKIAAEDDARLAKEEAQKLFKDEKVKEIDEKMKMEKQEIDELNKEKTIINNIINNPKTPSEQQQALVEQIKKFDNQIQELKNKISNAPHLVIGTTSSAEETLETMKESMKLELIQKNVKTQEETKRNDEKINNSKSQLGIISAEIKKQNKSTESEKRLQLAEAVDTLENQIKGYIADNVKISETLTIESNILNIEMDKIESLLVRLHKPNEEATNIKLVNVKITDAKKHFERVVTHQKKISIDKLNETSGVIGIDDSIRTVFVQLSWTSYGPRGVEQNFWTNNNLQVCARATLPCDRTNVGKIVDPVEYFNSLKCQTELERASASITIHDTSATVYVIGDIEGHGAALMNFLLEEKILDAAGTTWLKDNTYVVQCGDQIDPGQRWKIGYDGNKCEKTPENDLHTLLFTDYVQKLSDNKFINIIGNHEWLNVIPDKDDKKNEKRSVIICDKTYINTQVKDLFGFSEIFGKIMRRRYVLFRINDVLFSHAGVDKKNSKQFGPTYGAIDKFIEKINGFNVVKESFSFDTFDTFQDLVLYDMIESRSFNFPNDPPQNYDSKIPSFNDIKVQVIGHNKPLVSDKMDGMWLLKEGETPKMMTENSIDIEDQKKYILMTDINDSSFKDTCDKEEMITLHYAKLNFYDKKLKKIEFGKQSCNITNLWYTEKLNQIIKTAKDI